VLVYRDGSRQVRTAELQDEILLSLCEAAAPDSHSPDAALTALLRAGALECALADAAPASSPAAAVDAACRLSDVLADAVFGSAGAERSRRVSTAREILQQISRLDVPGWVRISAPESFAYYALDPVKYAAVAASSAHDDRPVCVIGLRTIGATLSALVAAAARLRGVPATRMTVRPGGHPFDRRTEFSAAEQARLREAMARRCYFLVVDEGPGLSGSSLLSVAEALEALGVTIGDIAVCCGHSPDLGSLRAPRAAERWSRLRVVAAGSTLPPPPDAVENWSGGAWRALLYADTGQWPAVWPHTERLKFGSRDGARLYKFEGLGPYGEAPMARARLAAEAGWSPPVEAAANGFGAYARIAGSPLEAGDLDASMLEALARYCDFRQREMPARDVSAAPLAQMLNVNLGEEFGWEEAAAAPEMARPVIADARVAPHEWLRDRDGRVWKTDVASHGDDHFYPGPTDIAWDLAGAIVEWRMDDTAAESFVARYRRLSGDDARARLPFYLRAYCAFRLGFCRMAAAACVEERERLTAAAEHYREWLLNMPARANVRVQGEVYSPV
jgi:hypothetical protein